MKSFRIFSLVLIIVPYMFFGATFALNMYLDPDQIIFKSGASPFMSRGEKRYQNAGIVNQYDMRNILVGGSLMNNFVPSEVARAMKWDKVFSLSFAGGDLPSNSRMAQYAMKRHQIDNVMFALHMTGMTDASSDEAVDPRSPNNYLYLYDDSRLNDFLVFAQVPTYFIKSFLQKKRQREELRAAFTLDDEGLFQASKDLYSHYMGLYRSFNRPLFISSLGTTEEKPVPLTEIHKKNLEENFRRYIEPLVAGNPKTQFSFIIPDEAFLANIAHRDILAFAIRYLVMGLSQYPNAKVYGFTNDAFNADLRLYTDLVHSHIEVSRYAIQEIAQDHHRLTKMNVDAYTRELRHILGSYKVPELWKTELFERGDGAYPKEGYITYHDAAKLIWGDKFSEALYKGIPRSPYLAEESYVAVEIKTSPPLDATRQQLETAPPLKVVHQNRILYDVR